MTVILTRPVADSLALADTLAEDGIASLIWPLTRIVDIPGDVTIPVGCDGLVFSSRHAVTAFVNRQSDRSIAAYCVGGATASEARNAGFATVIDGGGTAETLARTVAADCKNVLFVRGRDVTAALVTALASAVDLTEVVVYAAEAEEAVPAEVADYLDTNRRALLTVWSTRNAALLCDGLARIGVSASPHSVLAISERASAPVAEAGFDGVFVADAPTRDAMLAGMRRLAPEIAQQSATQ